MINKKLGKYRGKLSPEQIAEGMSAATDNAARLVNDANLLFERKRFPSAASLAILAIEEAGKVSILRMLAVAKDDKAVANCWHAYRSHTKKNVAWLLPQLVAEGARQLEDFAPLFTKGANHPFVLDQVKQIGFYTDCLGKAHWSVPEDAIDESLAAMLVEIAETFSKCGNTTSIEIELWIKHMKPVWMLDNESMKQALVDWYTEMQQHGLALEGDNKMEEFIHHGFSED